MSFSFGKQLSSKIASIFLNGSLDSLGNSLGKNGFHHISKKFKWIALKKLKNVYP